MVSAVPADVPGADCTAVWLLAVAAPVSRGKLAALIGTATPPVTPCTGIAFAAEVPAAAAGVWFAAVAAPVGSGSDAALIAWVAGKFETLTVPVTVVVPELEKTTGSGLVADTPTRVPLELLNAR
jgi:hypothetical protein